MLFSSIWEDDDSETNIMFEILINVLLVTTEHWSLALNWFAENKRNVDQGSGASGPDLIQFKIPRIVIYLSNNKGRRWNHDSVHGLLSK